MGKRNRKYFWSRTWLLLTVAAGLFLFAFQIKSNAHADPTPIEPPTYSRVLQWDANPPEDNVVAYRVYYTSGSPGYRILDSYKGEGLTLEESGTTRFVDSGFEISGVTCQLSGLEENTTYFFVATAVDGENRQSPPSREVSTDNTAPETPSGLTSSHSQNQPYTNREIEFSWSPSEDPFPGSGLSGYSILFDLIPESEPSDRYANFSGTSISLSAPHDGLYYLHLRALDVVGLEGVPNASGTVHYGPVWIETGPPSVLDRPMLDMWEGAVYVIYSEANMVGADSAGNYEMISGVTDIVVASVEDVSNEGRIFRLQISNFDPYLIYRLTIRENITDYAGIPLTGQREFTLNDDDQDGMADEWERMWISDMAPMDMSSDTDRDGIPDVEEYAYAVEHPELGASRWTLSPLDTDSDDDGIPDGYEIVNGLNPTDPFDRDLDPDGNKLSNYEEYVASVEAPLIDAVSADPAIEGIPYTGPAPTLSQGTLPVVWSLTGEIPSGMEIDPITGVVYWPEPVLGESSYTITIRAQNLAGLNDRFFELAVVPYHATVYVKGLSGGNGAGNGTLESPWSSISVALSEVQTWLSPQVTIRVAAGSFLENLIFLRSGIELEGGWNSDFTQRWEFDQSGVEPSPQYETIIDGQNQGSVIVAGSGTTIDGFTITGGNGTNGGGISGGDGLVVSNCKIIDNLADVGGGGIYLSTDSGTYPGTTSITRCLFANNSAQFGGGIYTNHGDIWRTVVSQCTFWGNSAESGGGMFNKESSPYVINCTFSGNAASGYGGAIGNFVGSGPEVRNSILWGDSAGVLGKEVYNDATSTAYVGFCDIKGCGGS